MSALLARIDPPCVIGSDATLASLTGLDALEWTARPTLLLNMIEHFRATLAWLPNFAFRHIVRMAPAGRD